jgi:hypothetical protein
MNDRSIQRTESVFLTGGLFVSDSRIEIGGRTFDPSKLTEAKTAIRRPHRGTAVIVAGVAIFFLLLGTGALSSGTRTVGGAILSVGIITAAMVPRLWRSKYHIVLIDGHPQSFVDMDGKFATELAAAINKAIAARKS